MFDKKWCLPPPLPATGLARVGRGRREDIRPKADVIGVNRVVNVAVVIMVKYASVKEKQLIV